MSKEAQTKKPSLWQALNSPIGRKVLTGITGLFLVLFVIVHMVGNLGYFSSDPETYNKYSDFLLGLGPIIYFIEFVLALAFLAHAIVGIQIYVGKRRARKHGYSKYESAGGPSRQTLSSRTMIGTGLVLLVFLVIHLISFKYGPGMDEGYVSIVDGGERIRDLKSLVSHKFNDPLYAFGYTAVMLLLGFHLRHGVWSAFQSLGAMNPKLTPVIYTIGVILAVAIAVGFLVLPLYVYFFVPDPGVPAAMGAAILP